MKKILFFLLLLPAFSAAQSEKLLNGYVYGMVHDGAGGGQQSITFNESGKYFYGTGAGIAWHFAKVGVFVSYIYRGYKYRYPDQVAADGQVDFGDKSVNANIFVAGILF